jgi:hypothetical protein
MNVGEMGGACGMYWGGKCITIKVCNLKEDTFVDLTVDWRIILNRVSKK